MKEEKVTGDCKIECDRFAGKSFHDSGEKSEKRENIDLKLGNFFF